MGPSDDSVAQELRTPLTRLRATFEDLEAASVNLTVTASEAASIAAIFYAVLRIARIEARRYTIVQSTVKPSHLPDNAPDLYELEAEARRVDLSRVIGEGLVASGDRDLLFQAVGNLLENATKFMRSAVRSSSSDAGMVSPRLH